MATKATTETSAKYTQMLDSLSLKLMQLREAVTEHRAPIAAAVSVAVYSQTEQSLSLLWLIQETHSGVALLCAASAFVGYIIRRR